MVELAQGLALLVREVLLALYVNVDCIGQRRRLEGLGKAIGCAPSVERVLK